METEHNVILQSLKEKTGQKFNDSPSPFTRWLDPVIREVSEGDLTFEYNVRHDMTNPLKTLHGGAIAGIMDDIIGAAIFSLGLKDYYTTINLSVDFFAPAIQGDVVLAQAKVLKKGKSIIHVVCDLTHKNSGRLLARGSSNLMKLDRKIARE